MPGTTQLEQPIRVVNLGKTKIDPETFELWVEEMGRTKYLQDTYSLFQHNCNNFSEDAAQFLGEKNKLQLNPSVPDVPNWRISFFEKRLNKTETS